MLVAAPECSWLPAPDDGAVTADDELVSLEGLPLFRRERYAGKQHDVLRLAMLFEEAMMAMHFGIQRDVAFGPVPQVDSDPLECSSYKVAWGVRGRIGATQVRRRIDLVLERLLPEREYGSRLDALPTPVAMNTQQDWCGNLSPGGSTRDNAALRTALPRAWNPYLQTGAHRR